MTRKIIVLAFMALCLCLSSCYPELSVQQYDDLREDLAEMDEERMALREELASVKEELDAFKEKNGQIKVYVDFMVQLIGTQNSESLLVGEFDVNALAEAKDTLIEASEKLENGEIHYYMSLIDPENEPGTVGAYYKAIEYCIKNIKQKLGVTPKP